MPKTTAGLDRRGRTMAESRDPVCGMKVNTERAPATGTYGGQVVYFCSVACRQKYEATHRPG
jgi:YHS domain-containing protein